MKPTYNQGMNPQEETVKLDAETRAALEEGIRLANENPRRWTTEEVISEAKELALEWRKKTGRQASA